MTVEQYELLTGEIVPDGERAMIAARISAAIVHIDNKCCHAFRMVDGLGNVTYEVPEDVQMGVVLLVKSMSAETGVASYSLAGMSQSFFQGGEYAAASSYWSPYACGDVGFI